MHHIEQAWRLLRLALAGLASAVLTSPVYADVSINGFGQVVAGSALSNDRIYSPYLAYSADTSFSPESLFALQVRAPLTDRLSATAQIVASGTNNNDFTPQFEWAYASYRISDNWLLKAGRQLMPLYRYSDYLEVGEAYPWIRPPVSVYQAAITNIDGLSARGYYELGRWSLQPQVMYGSGTQTTSATGFQLSFTQHNTVGAVLDATYNGWLSLRASYFYTPQNNASVSGLDEFIAFLRMPELAPGVPNPGYNPATADALATDGDSGLFYGLGIGVHRGHWMLDAEYVYYRFNNSVLQAPHEYYVSAGYRLGRFTPVLTFGHVDGASSNPAALNLVTPGSICNPTPIFEGQPPGPQDTCHAIVGGIINGQRDLSDYYEFTGRYDVSNSIALKIDFSRRLSHNPPGYGYETSFSANLVSAGVVFMF